MSESREEPNAESSSNSKNVQNEDSPPELSKSPPQDTETTQLGRAQWGSDIEFLMSCIATSVGLGNVWRFPFVAYQNGGGAFLVPYIIVLMLIGKPMYYLEGVVGQFSSRNSVQVWSMVPALKGTGYAQAVGAGYILSYYVAVVSFAIYYLFMSFRATLPWAVCEPEWYHCVPSDETENVTFSDHSTSSAEYYFRKTVLQQRDGIEGGIGYPIWYLTICLFISWLAVFLIVARGVKSSGKAAYFLAIFPYVVMFLLLVNTVILDGAGTGILFFFTPQWKRLLELKVWYSAVTQVFFSLSVGTGAIIMFSSYNGFQQKIYRDAMIVTTLDTCTSLISGVTIFGILGNLAHHLGEEVEDVVGSGGTGLAFISYPDAIAKTFAPQLFAVMFFLMMGVLGVGSAVALMSTINTVMMDAFPHVRTVYMSAFCCILGFLLGLFYVTPGGQYILELVDYYGGTFLVLFCGIAEVGGVFWIYGLENLCLDIEFMTGKTTGIYWRMCWGFLTPAFMLVVFVYALVSFEALLFGGYYVYPLAGYISGYIILFAGIILVPIFICYGFYKHRTGNFKQTFKNSFIPNIYWGPRNEPTRSEWVLFKQEAEARQARLRGSRFKHIWNVLTGGYRKNLH